MQNGVIFQAQPYGLGLNETLMPQYLKELGYETHGVGKVWELSCWVKKHLFLSLSKKGRLVIGNSYFFKRWLDEEIIRL